MRSNDSKLRPYSKYFSFTSIKISLGTILDRYVFSWPNMALLTFLFTKAHFHHRLSHDALLARSESISFNECAAINFPGIKRTEIFGLLLVFMDSQIRTVS